MEDEFKELRAELHEAINLAITKYNPEATGVTGWILIAEQSVDAGKRRNLLGISGDVIGENDIPPWTARGWLEEVLEDAWDYFAPVQEEDN